MTWMNEYEVEEALCRYDDTVPNLRKGAIILSRLVIWTNSHSDGWPYWNKPAHAARSLMDLLYEPLYRWDRQDITEADLNKALRPIKAFLTRQRVDHGEVMIT